MSPTQHALGNKNITPTWNGRGKALLIVKCPYQSRSEISCGKADRILSYSAEDGKTTVVKEVEKWRFFLWICRIFRIWRKRAKVQNEPASQNFLVAQLVPESSGTGKLQVSAARPGLRPALKNFSRLSSCTGFARAPQRLYRLCRCSQLTVKPERQHQTTRRRGDQTQAKETSPEGARDCQWYRLVTSWLLRTSSDVFHYVGRCWRKPGRDIKKWQYYGQEQPGEQEYDHYCKHCWS